jgi:pyruvate,water dikinase
VAKTHWPAKINRRKEILEQFKEWNPPPALGAVPSPPLNAVFVSLMGLSQEKIDEWLKAEEPESKEITELTGIAASSGIVEGPARVCSKAMDISTLMAGEILVAPQTSPTWAPAFNTIGGAIMDQGGLFAHASIVCREYKLPAVVGTTIGTRVIKTGDQLRVDGDNGTVTILKRAK